LSTSTALNQLSGIIGGPFLLILALVLLFAGLTVLMASVLGYFTRRQRPEEVIKRRLSIYTVGGRQPKRAFVEEQSTRFGESAVARSAVELAGRVVHRQGVDQVMNRRIEAAGLPLRTAEWMLLHIGVAVGIAVLCQLLSGGSFPATVFGLGLGLAGPWVALSLLRDRRQAQFLTQLPDTLQLIAGGLQAGYSVPQSLDSVVREGSPPMSVEFNRALVEGRLGVPIEDALEGIAARMSSKDFGWVVMAIRIQREVGGNLAELLMIVAETMRERDRLRRQVQALSAEGRLSGAVLILLPIGLLGFMLVAQPTYVGVLFTTPLGVLLLVLAGILILVGSFWISRLIKVEV